MLVLSKRYKKRYTLEEKKLIKKLLWEAIKQVAEQVDRPAGMIRDKFCKIVKDV